MRAINMLGVVLAALPAFSVVAAEPLRRQPQAIEVYSVSPGATGSIDSSARSQQYQLPAAPGLPAGVTTRSTTSYGRSAVQQSGTIRQSIEYPNGLQVPQHSGQSGYLQQRDE